MMAADNTKRVHEIIEEIKIVCETHKDLLINKKLILFGSRATGKYKERSDFDLGILSGESDNFVSLCKLKDALDELPTLYSIDLVDLNNVPVSFRNEALKNYTVLYD